MINRNCRKTKIRKTKQPQMGKGNRPKQKRPKVLLLLSVLVLLLLPLAALLLRCQYEICFVCVLCWFLFFFLYFILCKIIKISKSSLKCKKCVEVCVCVCGGRTHADQWQRGRERDRERGAYCSIYSTYNASSATQFPSSYESRSFNSFTCISLYLPRPPPLLLCSVRQFKFVLFNSDSVKLKKYHTDYNLAHRIRARAKDWPIKPTGFGRDNSQQIRIL